MANCCPPGATRRRPAATSCARPRAPAASWPSSPSPSRLATAPRAASARRTRRPLLPRGVGKADRRQRRHRVRRLHQQRRTVGDRGEHWNAAPRRLPVPARGERRLRLRRSGEPQHRRHRRVRRVPYAQAPWRRRRRRRAARTTGRRTASTSTATASIDLDLPGMGADPRHKDIFVELDFMPPHRFDAGGRRRRSRRPSPTRRSRNPDGTTGIALHLDNGADSVMNPRTGALWGSRSRQSSIPHQDVARVRRRRPSTTGARSTRSRTPTSPPRAAGVPLRDLRARTRRHGSAASRATSPAATCSSRSAPAAWPATGSDCTLDATRPGRDADARARPQPRPAPRRRRRPDLNKPNYLSVMNYNFQLTGPDAGQPHRSSWTTRASRSPLNETRARRGARLRRSRAVRRRASTRSGVCPNGAQTAWFARGRADRLQLRRGDRRHGRRPTSTATAPRPRCRRSSTGPRSSSTAARSAAPAWRCRHRPR